MCDVKVIFAHLKPSFRLKLRILYGEKSEHGQFALRLLESILSNILKTNVAGTISKLRISRKEKRK